MSSTISLRMLMKGTTIYFSKQCKIKFGAYTKAHKKIPMRFNATPHRTRYMPWTNRKPPRFLLVLQPPYRTTHQTTYLNPSHRTDVRYRLYTRACRCQQLESCSWLLWPPWKSHPIWRHPQRQKWRQRRRSCRSGGMWQPNGNPGSDNTIPPRGNSRSDNTRIGRGDYRDWNTRRRRREHIN